MERVLNQSWQWAKAWVPPGITAIALVATMVGLWFVMMNPDRALFTASGATGKSEPSSTATTFSQPSSVTARAAKSVTRGSTLAHATPTTECTALEKEIDSVTVRIRAAGKSKQGVRFRSRLRELKELYGEECKPGAGPAT